MDKSILENELLIDGFLYRLEETGPERSLPIMELSSDSEGEIAIYMDGDCDCSDEDRAILILNEEEEELNSFEWNYEGLKKCISKHFSMQNQLDESTYFQRINDLAFGDIRLIDENGLKIEIPKSSFLEIVLNEDVSCEFEESNDIHLESIYLDNLSISYDDGTENYADYFLKKDHYSISKLDIEGNGKGLYFIKSLALKLNGDHEQKEEFERLYKCTLDFLDQIQTINFSLLLGNKIIAEIETYDAYINIPPS